MASVLEKRAFSETDDFNLPSKIFYIMANALHVEILCQGAFIWNDWRKENPKVVPDFTGFNFARYKTNTEVYPRISGGDRWLETHWDYNSINLINVDLSNAILINCIFSRKHMIKSNFSGADFTGALMNDVLLKNSDFNNTTFNNVNLKGATIVNCSFEGSIITNSYIFGVSSWGTDVDLEGSKQSNLIITREEEEIITVDNIQDANLIYNLCNNKSASHIIDNISNKLVFILGNFSPERKDVLIAIKDKLRIYNLIPLIFDFDRPKNRNLKESVLLFANLSKFVIADLTDGRSVQRELEIIALQLASVVIQPIIQKNEKIYGMLEDIFDFQQVLPLFEYSDTDHLLKSLKLNIIDVVLNKLGSNKEERKRR